MTRKEEAVEHFNEGFNCCKAVVSAFASDVDLDEKTRQCMTTPYRELLGKPQGLCGAVAGAVRLIELSKKDKADAMPLVTRFRDEFLAKNNSVDCSELLGCDLSTYEGKFKEMEENLCATHCVKYVSDAVDILEEILMPKPAGVSK